MKNDLKSIFSFSEQDAVREIDEKLGLTSKIKDSFKYLTTVMEPQPLPDKLSKLKWEEGKNYDWTYIKVDNVELIIRRYQQHFTIFTKLTKTHSLEGVEYNFVQKKYSSFEFSTDGEKLTDEESDERVDDRFYDIDKHIQRLVDVIKKDAVNKLWNSVSYEREDFIKITPVFAGEIIYTIDKLLFACDEICSKYLEMFATNDVYKLLSEYKVGEVFGKDFYGETVVSDIKTELKDGYWHGVGLTIKNTQGKKEFWDVYKLTRWATESIQSKIAIESVNNLTL